MLGGTNVAQLYELSADFQPVIPSAFPGSRNLGNAFGVYNALTSSIQPPLTTSLPGAIHPNLSSISSSIHNVMPTPLLPAGVQLSGPLVAPIATGNRTLPEPNLHGTFLEPQVAKMDIARDMDLWTQPTSHSSMYLQINQFYPGLQKLHELPPVYTIENFLSHEECDALIEVAGPLLQRSKTHAIMGSESTKGRTSLTCHLSKSLPPCPGILEKINLLTNKPYDHIELPQVARYTCNQRYVEHYDGVDPHTECGRVFCASGGQRIATILMYLNDVSEGGATLFRRLNLEVSPRKGRALIFFPGFLNGEVDTDALHAGMPAVDTKWVSQVWIRQSFRADGQPSIPVPLSEQTIVGPLHEGLYAGRCLAGDDLHDGVYTWEEAKTLATNMLKCVGFTYEHQDKVPVGKIHCWFKSELEVLYMEGWWTYSTGLGM